MLSGRLLGGGSVWSLVDSAYTRIAIGAGTGNTINMPTFAAGDLLVYWDFTDANASTPSGWTNISSSNIRIRIKVAVGGETLTNTTAPTNTYDVLVMVAAFRHAEGLTPTFVKGAFVQRAGPEEFALAGMAAGGTSYKDCLVVFCSQKNGSAPVNTDAIPLTGSSAISLRSGTTIMDPKLIRPPEDGFYPGGGDFYSHLGGAYATGHDSSAVVDEFRYNYSQWYIAQAGDSTNAHTLVFRGV